MDGTRSSWVGREGRKITDTFFGRKKSQISFSPFFLLCFQAFLVVGHESAPGRKGEERRKKAIDT